MKLYNFKELQKIREQITLTPIPLEMKQFNIGHIDKIGDTINKDEFLKKLVSDKGLEGKEINKDDITFDENKIANYRGKIFFLYMKKQNKNPDKEYKFHFAECDALKARQEDGFYHRYHLINLEDHKDRKFPVIEYEYGYAYAYEKEYKEIKKPMKPCINCLDETKFKGFRYPKWYKNKNYKDLVDNFPFEEFFKTYKQEKFKQPSSKNDTYSVGRKIIAKSLRRELKNICQKCKIDFSGKESEGYLSVHHIDKNKRNNNSDNLKLLCLVCHSEEEGEGHKELKKQLFYEPCLNFIKIKKNYEN